MAICDECCESCPFADCILDEETPYSIAGSDSLDADIVEERTPSPHVEDVFDWVERRIREKNRELGRVYRLKHADKVKAYQKEYRLKHADKVKAYQKEYRLKHVDKAKAYQKEYRLKHADKAKAYQKEYRERKKAERIVQQHKRLSASERV